MKMRIEIGDADADLYIDGDFAFKTPRFGRDDETLRREVVAAWHNLRTEASSRVRLRG